MASFDDIQYCIYADKVGGWGPKRPKICSRTIGMVPLEFTHLAKLFARKQCSVEDK